MFMWPRVVRETIRQHKKTCMFHILNRQASRILCFCLLSILSAFLFRVSSSLEPTIHTLPNNSPFCSNTAMPERDEEGLKVISYALFRRYDDVEGFFRAYLRGMQWNIKNAQLYYPEWVVRIYITNLSNDEEMELLQTAGNVQLVRCHNSSALFRSNSLARTTRFLAYDDPRVSRFLSRDADSRFSPRELFAVNEWVASGLGFHTMRDHPFHGTEVLAGMFGMAAKSLGNHRTMKSLLLKALVENEEKIPGPTGEDQHFLTEYVWPLVSSSSLAHDMDEVRCRSYRSQVCRDFPIHGRDEASNYFVGAAFTRSVDDAATFPSDYNCSCSCAIHT